MLYHRCIDCARRSQHAFKTEEDHLTGSTYTRFVATAMFAVAVAGCATTGRQAAAEPDEDQTYVTGSRLPGRNGATGATKTISDKDSINRMMNKGGNAVGGVTGAAGQ